MDVRPLLLVVAVLLASAALATPCADDQASGCANTAVQTAEEQLDTLYQQVLQQQGQHSVLSRRLVNTQRAWRTFRDTECEYVGSYGKEPGQHQEGYNQCVLIMTEQRTQALLRYQQCQAANEQCSLVAP